MELDSLPHPCEWYAGRGFKVVGTFMLLNVTHTGYNSWEVKCIDHEAQVHRVAVDRSWFTEREFF